MPLISATRDQFKVEPNRITHIPTGAWWGGYPGNSYPSWRNPGTLGNIQPNGDDYNVGQTEQLALDLYRAHSSD